MPRKLLDAGKVTKATVVVPVGRRFDILDKVQGKLSELFKGSPIYTSTLYANETLTVRQHSPLDCNVRAWPILWVTHSNFLQQSDG